MADVKISGLPASTTPLAGTEVLPIVQGGVTKQVANNDLRPKQIQSNATSGVLQVVGPAAATTRVMTTPDANFTAARIDAAQSFVGDQTLATGNLVIGTSGKGIDFSVTPGTGTSELFADYEEGTWTPTLITTGGSVTLNATLTKGLYTKIGRQVTLTGLIYVTSVSSPTGTASIGSVPFNSAADYGGRSAAAIAAFDMQTTATTSIQLFINGADNVMYLKKFAAGVSLDLATDIKANTSFNISITYFTA